jgi:hypothetical protein
MGTTTIQCPACGKPIGLLNKRGVLQATCVSCRYQLRAVSGILAACSSTLITIKGQSEQHTGLYQRQYELRVVRPDQHLETLEFRQAGKEDLLPFRTGDQVLVLMLLRGDQHPQILSVRNCTTGREYPVVRLLKPLHQVFTLPRMIGLSVGIAIYLILLAPFPNSSNAGRLLALILAGASGVVATACAKQYLQPEEFVTPEQRQRVQEQNLLIQKESLERRVQQLQLDQQSHQDLIEQMQALQAQMLEVGRSLYASRIDTMEQAIQLLTQQCAQDQKLLAAYRETIQMLEIEYETSQVAAHLPDAAQNMLLDRMEELKAIEAQNQNLRLQIEANEEVQQLRSGVRHQ